MSTKPQLVSEKWKHLIDHRVLYDIRRLEDEREVVDAEIDRLQAKADGLEVLWEDALKRLIGLDMIERELEMVNKRWEFFKRTHLVMSETETKRQLGALIEAAELRIRDKR